MHRLVYWFAGARGIITAASVVSSGAMNWVVSQTQTHMTLRAYMQLIAGICIIVVSPYGAQLSRLLDVRSLVTGLGIAMTVVVWGIAQRVDAGIVTAEFLALSALAVALIEALLLPAQEALQNSLSQLNSAAEVKNRAVKLRIGCAFATRFLLGIATAWGLVSLQGASTTSGIFLAEALILCFLSICVFAFVPITRLTEGVSRSHRVVACGPLMEIGQTWYRGARRLLSNRPMLTLFSVDFALQAFAFLGGMMLPRALPDADVGKYSLLLAIGALGAFLGMALSRPRLSILFVAGLGDALATLIAFSCSTFVGIALSWFLASMCYGALENIFSRSIQSATPGDSSDMAALRRMIVGGLKPMTWVLLLHAQVLLEIGDKQLVMTASAISFFALLLLASFRGNLTVALRQATET